MQGKHFGSQGIHPLVIPVVIISANLSQLGEAYFPLIELQLTKFVLCNKLFEECRSTLELTVKHFVARILDLAATGSLSPVQKQRVS